MGIANDSTQSETRNATEVNWDTVQHFRPTEWPAGTLEWMSASLILVVDQIRHALPQDHYMYPSTLYRAHVRHDESDSRHSTHNRSRLSDATDLYMDWKTVWLGWLTAVQHKHVGGLGIYVDTEWDGQSRPMLHIDTRPWRVLWIRHSMRYYYHHDDPKQFHYLMGRYGAY